MDSYIIIAIIGALINIILSTLIPCVFKETKISFLTDVKKIFEYNKQLIVTSSMIVGIMIYLALIVSDEFELISGMSNIASLTLNDDKDAFEIVENDNIRISGRSNPMQNIQTIQGIDPMLFQLMTRSS
jgi:hypothetical protein